MASYPDILRFSFISSSQDGTSFVTICFKFLFLALVECLYLGYIDYQCECNGQGKMGHLKGPVLLEPRT